MSKLCGYIGRQVTSGEKRMRSPTSARFTAWETKRALEYYEQALPLHRKVGDRAGEARTMRSMFWIHLKQGRLEEAIMFMERMIELDVALRDARLKSDRTTLTRLHALNNLLTPRSCVFSLILALALLVAAGWLLYSR
jgi:hypothetical protein